MKWAPRPDILTSKIKNRYSSLVNQWDRFGFRTEPGNKIKI